MVRSGLFLGGFLCIVLTFVCKALFCKHLKCEAVVKIGFVFSKPHAAEVAGEEYLVSIPTVNCAEECKSGASTSADKLHMAVDSSGVGAWPLIWRLVSIVSASVAFPN